MSIKYKTQTKENFATLQAGRAIAAVLVVLYHNAGSIFALEKYWGVDPTKHFFDFGHSGVEFFFVLSGFIIAHAHWHDLDRRHKLIPYLLSRFVRIYPFYWIVLLTLIPVYFITPSFGKGYERDILVILSSTSLIHFSNGFTIIPVAWTLYHEILFYSLFSLAIINKRWGLTILCIWLIGSITQINIPRPLTENELNVSSFGFYFSPLHLLFGIGLLTSLLLRRNSTFSSPRIFSLAGVIFFFITGMEENFIQWLPGNYRSMVYGLCSALGIIGFVSLERQGKLHVPYLFRLLGDASYVIYLMHLTILSLLAKIFTYYKFDYYLSATTSFVTLTILTISLGLLIHIYFEKKILKFFKKLLISKNI